MVSASQQRRARDAARLCGAIALAWSVLTAGQLATVQLVVAQGPDEPSEAGARAGAERASSRGDSDDDVARWAATEVGRRHGRAVGGRPPLPPDGYLEGPDSDGPPLQLRLEPAQDLVRVLSELGMGALGVALGGGAGALLVWATSEGGGEPTWLVVSVGAAAMLGAVGVTAGVTLAGHLTSGHGNFGHAFLGQIVGAAAALPLVVVGQANDLLALSLAAAGLLPLAGAVIGYELGHADDGLAGIVRLTPTMGGALATVAGQLP